MFSINITWTSFIYSVLIVKTPKNFAKSEFLLFVKCLVKAGRSLRYRLSSEGVIVLIIYFLSYEKKKNDPDLPAPSPALNTMSLFNLGFNDCWKLLNCYLKNYACISINKGILWYVILTLWFNVNTSAFYLKVNLSLIKFSSTTSCVVSFTTSLRSFWVFISSHFSKSLIFI